MSTPLTQKYQVNFVWLIEKLPTRTSILPEVCLKLDKTRKTGRDTRMKQIIPEVYVKDAINALDFYKDLFGGKVKNLQLSDQLPMFKDQPGKVVHAELHINARCVLYFADIFDERRKRCGNMTLMLHMENMSEIERAYDILSQNGKVGMPLQQTFWGAWHAIVTDKFGAPWALSFAPKI